MADLAEVLGFRWQPSDHPHGSIVTLPDGRRVLCEQRRRATEHEAVLWRELAKTQQR